MGTCGSYCGCSNENGEFKTNEVQLDDQNAHHGSKTATTTGLMNAQGAPGSGRRQNGQYNN